ncbi:MAG: hypothetical protein QOH49_4042 [Acidobacteriota bacterium]|jgi:hypothetical protein|nr:hypothetical protein [Acidobacteriota bacterium]
MRGALMIVEWTRYFSMGAHAPRHTPRDFQLTAMTFARFTSEPALPATLRFAAYPIAVRVLMPSGMITVKRQT